MVSNHGSLQGLYFGVYHPRRERRSVYKSQTTYQGKTVF
jgi:hypothetical protein